MSNFQFKERANKVNKICEKTLQILSTRGENEIKDIVHNFKKFLLEHSKKEKLTIAFIGQYSSGKSTIIAALTNASFVNKYYEKIDNDEKLIEVYRIGSKELKIGVEITTDKTEVYEWEEVLLIDTPGIYAGRPEHDKITLDQISKSDLLVFVIPNELFNSQTGKFFRKICNEMQRVGQMVLVINKMGRETGAPENLIKTILQVIEPYHPDDFYTCFIDANSYLQAKYEEDDEEKQFLIEESHFGDLLESLNKLIKRNQLYAKLVTPLHRAVDVIEQSLNILTAEDKISRDLLEILRREALILRASQTRLRNKINRELNTFEHKIKMLGEKVVDKIDGQHKDEEINAEIKNAEWEIQSLSERLLENIQSLVKDELTNLQSDLEELQKSPLGRSLSKEFEVAGIEAKPIGEIETQERKKISPILIKGPEVFAKLGKFTSKVSRDLVYNTGKFFGIKFKPWGAVKCAKFINKLAPILAGVGTILDIIITVNEEDKRKEYEQKLREARASIRENFRQISSERRKNIENGGKDDGGNRYEGLNNAIFKDFYQKELVDIEQQQNEFRQIEKSKKDVVAQLNNLLSEIKDEISSFT